MHLPLKPGIGASVEPLNAHLLQLTVDRLNRMTMRAQFDDVHQPGVRTHGRPAHERMGAAALRPDRLGQDARRISGAVAANGKGESKGE